MLLCNKQGYTLTELIVVMAIFIIVIMISATAFENIVYRSSQQTKSAETQIEGIVGLEVLRGDLEQAGFGLPWEFSQAINYNESAADANDPTSFWPTGKSSQSFNDSGTPGNPPRAILSDNTTFNKDGANIGSKYLVIKSMLAAANNTSKKWTSVSFDKDGTKNIRQWGATDRDFVATDRVIVVKNPLNATSSRQLMATGSTVFFSTFANYSTLTNPHNNGDTFEIYGVDPNDDLRMPFNRADYYIMRPAKMPKECVDSAGVGILYKSTIIQGTGSSAGKLTSGMPLLDCVADMQVVYGLDTDGAGRVNLYQDTPASTAADIRSQLKEVRVYILAQEGKKDRLYTYPSETVMVGEVLNDNQRGRVFNLNYRIGPDYKYYRWKVYTIVVRPKNLIQ